MSIDFGLNLDGAPWSSMTSGSTAVTVVPIGFLRILQTRLGTSHPAVIPAVRVA